MQAIRRTGKVVLASHRDEISELPQFQSDTSKV
jgi:hypothetical protein